MVSLIFFFFNDTATTEIYTLSLHDALPISVPGGTPASVVMKLNTAFNEALADPPIRRKLLELGFVPVGGAPQAYVAVLANEIAKWRKVIKESKIPPPT